MLPIIETIPLRQMASGDILNLQVYKFINLKSIGDHPGKKVYIQSNLHGSEISGNAVIYQLIEFLSNINDDNLWGEIWLVPLCNPMGVNERAQHFSPGRFCVYEGKDWNRIFWDFAKENYDLLAFAQSQLDFDLDTVRKNYLAEIKSGFLQKSSKINSQAGLPFTEIFRYQLQSLCLDADYVIDLHSANNQGLDYVYYFPNREDAAKNFLLDYGILLDEYDGDAFDEAFIKPWLALESAFASLGKNVRFDVEAWTLELGSGMQIKADSVNKGVLGIKNYLVQKGVLQIPDLIIPESKSEEMLFVSSSKRKKYCATVGGMIKSRVKLGTVVKAGDWLYEIITFNKEGKIPRIINICAESDGLVYDLSINEAVNQGEFVLGLLEL
ncbi:MAG: succinylglutamate desuccinylase [Nostocales cyanobacterium]|nr:MAG: succinylglutamate desuccinylase [Nostocales cyanobacterium]TAF12645.1 MAG: succinylglutamate desuccinylase [Nostocales cyanobacterium]